MRYLYTLLAMMALSMVFAQYGNAAEHKRVPFASDISSPIVNYNRATPTLATSGQLGDGAIQELADKGFSTIIDLRTEAEGTKEEQAEVEKAGMKYINIPITGAAINDEQLEAFTEALEGAEGLVLIHCRSANRVGAMLTSYYLSKGVDKDTAFERGITAGLKPSLEQKIRDNCNC